MSMQIKSGYTNPLTTINRNKFGIKQGPLTGKPNSKSDNRVQELRTKQQQLQNELLLMKSTGSDTGGVSAEKLKKMEESLAEVSNDLKSAKTESSFPAEKSTLSSLNHKKPDLDSYEKEDKKSFLELTYKKTVAKS